MFAHLRGVLLEKHPNQAIVETHGVGYDVAISVPTFATTASLFAVYTGASAANESCINTISATPRVACGVRPSFCAITLSWSVPIVTKARWACSKPSTWAATSRSVDL